MGFALPAALRSPTAEASGRQPCLACLVSAAMPSAARQTAADLCVAWGCACPRMRPCFVFSSLSLRPLLHSVHFDNFPTYRTPCLPFPPPPSPYVAAWSQHHPSSSVFHPRPSIALPARPPAPRPRLCADLRAWRFSHSVYLYCTYIVFVERSYLLQPGTRTLAEGSCIARTPPPCLSYVMLK